MQAVGPLAAGSQRKADPCGRAQGVEIDALLREIDARHSHHPPVLHRILNGEYPGEETRLLVDVVHGAEVDPAETLLDRTRQLPLIHLLEFRGVVNQNVFGKEVQELSVRGYPDVGELPLLILGPRDRAQHLVLFQVVLQECRRADFEAIGQLRVGFGEQDDVTVQRVRFKAADANLLAAFAQLEGVDYLPRGDVHDLHIFLIRAEDVEALAVLAEAHPARDSRSRSHFSRNLFCRLIDDQNPVAKHAEVEGSVTPRELFRRGSLLRRREKRRGQSNQ